MKAITYSKTIIVILTWYGIMVLNGTSCFKSIEKKYWSVDSKRGPKNTSGISEKELLANDFPADTIKKDDYLSWDHKMVDESIEEKSDIDELKNSSFDKRQPSMPNDSTVSLDDAIRTDPADKENQDKEMTNSFNQEHEKQNITKTQEDDSSKSQDYEGCYFIDGYVEVNI